MGSDEVAKIQVARDLRRIFGKFYDEISYMEMYYAMSAQLENPELQIINMIFEDEKKFKRKPSTEMVSEIKTKIEGQNISKGAKDRLKAVVDRAAESLVKSLVEQGLHNDSVRVMLTSTVVFEGIMTKEYLEDILRLLDAQTLNDVNTNFMSKLKMAYLGLERKNPKARMLKELNSILNNDKFSKRPLTFIQNVEALVMFLYKVETADCGPIQNSLIKREHVKTLKEHFENILIARQEHASQELLLH